MLENRLHQIVNSYGCTLTLSDYGIAYRVNNDIIMNRCLLKYPIYCNNVLTHELKHSPGWKLDDLKLDIMDGKLWDNLIFCFKHPKAFTQFIPFCIYKKNFLIDVNQLVIYLIAFVLIYLFLQWKI